MRSRGDEEEERWRAREQELLVRLEDSRGRERKLEDQKHNLEVCLADATQQIQELKVPSSVMTKALALYVAV
jgi:rootletin